MSRRELKIWQDVFFLCDVAEQVSSLIVIICAILLDNMNMTLTYVDAEGMVYAVKDVAAAGDCAVLALLQNPMFPSAFSSCDELRRFIVSFVRGPNQVDCKQIYAIVGDRSHLHFDVYLGHVMMPRFWVGTVFFLWTSIAFGIKIRSHYFNEFREPKVECTGDFLQKYFPHYVQDDWQTVDVYFHQYGSMTRCKPSMYNHFAALLPLTSVDAGGLPCLNELVNQVGIPWWKKTDEMNGYDCSKKQPKPSVQKKNMNKEDRKKYNQALTYHYLKEQENGDDLAQMMKDRLDKATADRDDSIDIGVVQVKSPEHVCSEALASTRSLSCKKEHRSWIQRANIIFLFLHPRIGHKNLAITSALSGVNEHTLSGWLHQRKMIATWIDFVEELTASVAMKALPSNIRELYLNVDPDSRVSVGRYRKRLNRYTSTINIFYKGGKVSLFLFNFCYLFYNIMFSPLPISFLLSG